MAAEDRRPAEDVDTKKFADRYSLDGVVDRVFDNQYRYIDTSFFSPLDQFERRHTLHLRSKPTPL